MKSYLVIIAILIAFSCKATHEDYYTKNSLVYDTKTNKPYTGIVKVAHDDKLIEYQVKNGIKDGPFTMSLKNGRVMMKGLIDKGRNTGEWQYFFSTGELESQGSFVNDIPEGVWAWYYPNGKLRETGKYVKGNRDSVWVNYDQNGVILIKKNFNMGKELSQ